MKNKIINIVFITTICAFLITSIFFLVNKSFNNHIVITKEYTQKNNILLYSFPAKYHEESTQEDLNTTNEDIIYQNYNDVIEVINDKNNIEENKNKQDNIIEDNYLSQDNNNNNNQNIEVLQEDIQNSIISNNQIISKKGNIIFGIVNNKEISIEDRTTGYCAQALDFYYQDYYFTCIKSQNVFVIVNNNEFTISYALNNKIVTIDELIQIGFKPLKKNNYAVK